MSSDIKNNKQIQHVKVIIQQQDLHLEYVGISLTKAFMQLLQVSGTSNTNVK